MSPPVERAARAAAGGGEKASARGRAVVGLAQWVRHLEGWRRLALAAVAGALSVLAMAPFHWWWVLCATLPVLVWLIDGKDRDPSPKRGAFAAGWAWGFGYFFFGLYWIGEAFLVEAEVFAWLLPFAVTVMPAGLALFYGVATAVARTWWPGGFARVVVLAVALGVAEWLRGHILTGFPWNVLGYALAFDLATMQSAGVLGIYGLTLVAVAGLAAPLVLVADGARRAPLGRALLPGAAILAATFGALYAYGTARLSSGPPPAVAGVKLRVVQPAIPQRDKWRPELQREIFETHLRLTGTRPDGSRDDAAGITHVIWPEAAMPFMPLSSPEALAAIGETLPDDVHLLSGALRLEAGPEPGARRRAYNSLMVFDGAGRLVTLYDKTHLVPFGEYLPFQATLEAIGLEQLTRMRGGFSTGPKPRPLIAIPGLPDVAGLICYEAIFPAAVVQGVRRPGLLVNVTNDGWFGNSIGPRQHLHQARLRAVEEGLPLIRAANNGISAVIDAQGRLLARLELDQKGVIDSALPGPGSPTIYARFGDLPFWLLAALMLALAAAVAYRSSRLCVDAKATDS